MKNISTTNGLLLFFSILHNSFGWTSNTKAAPRRTWAHASNPSCMFRTKPCPESAIHIPNINKVHVGPALRSTQTDGQSTTSTSSNTEDDHVMMNFGILLSSFTDGMASTSTRQFFQYSLASLLAMDKIIETQDAIEESAKFSPCQVPDVDLLTVLEQGDELGLSLGGGKSDSVAADLNREERTKLIMQYIAKSHDVDMDIRVLYIPTAMYALRADSNNSPGKQRQRARADGKKRRNQLVRYIEDHVSTQISRTEGDNDNNSDSDNNDSGSGDDVNVNILAVTLDLDDGSIKQTSGSEDVSKFPSSGKEALTTWNPHIVYLEGGNTFWLHHCMEKGEEDWMQLIRDACCSKSTSTTDADICRRPALYIGKSAGAIVAGKYVETATWKGWDDPSVVPGKETYENWAGDDGLNLAGGASFFPHMSEDWLDLVKEKKDSLPKNDNDGNGSRQRLYCLQEWDACCIEASAAAEEDDLFISS